ncbi:DHA2 family efflux MFS transporter permease subunit [Nocardioides sp. Kera G14]|uniref:DHA2 family efflux MFS transporter permease subunit n=1 Tax=Nocardioides sp. Kera G14 TaxID=2884264 RepID=UPI001D10D6B8|nr:DHA2 family efflux MFS transporter permease subunit [Nocardioides sp. Kera G14]UDY23188.1 DHA2 family efflux MFS transporter permease subunit [Nocardioides sp. Kera G14]
MESIVGALVLDVSVTQNIRPWPALFALVLGFFMILVDLTIVTVAVPTIMEKLDASVNQVVWVSSAYMLAYAVPVLITGRLGDRFGSKYLYLAGLVVFTLASLWCGLTGSIEMLIIARVVQGLGASMITPQTMAIITRIFAPAERGKAMAVWGATAGVAMVVGPILGGVLVDWLGWEWIFFVNIPVGIVGFVLAWRLVPALETHEHSFDWLGVALSGIGLFLIAFGIQEGHDKHWAGWIIGMIVGGVLLMCLFVLWQARNRREPLVPLGLFTDKNFSVSNVAITVMGGVGASMGYPLMLYAQVVRGYSPTQSALLMFPMAVMSIILAKFVGGLTDRLHPRAIMSFGFAASFIGMGTLALQLDPDSSLVLICLSMVVIGVGNAFIWAPTAATATRNLPMQLAGAGSGVYNATRQVGSVIGSAAIAVLMDARLEAHHLPTGFSPETGGGSLPAKLADPFASSMSQAMMLPAGLFVVGLIAVLFYERPKHAGYAGADATPEAAAVAGH